MRISLSVLFLYGELEVAYSGEVRTVDDLVFGRLVSARYSGNASGKYLQGEFQIILWPSCGAYAPLASFLLKEEGGHWHIEQDSSHQSVPVRLIDAKVIPEGG